MRNQGISPSPLTCCSNAGVGSLENQRHPSTPNQRMKGAELWEAEEVEHGGGRVLVAGKGMVNTSHQTPGTSDQGARPSGKGPPRSNLQRSFSGRRWASFLFPPRSFQCLLPLSPDPPATVVLLLLVACSCCCSKPRGRKAQVRPMTPP